MQFKLKYGVVTVNSERVAICGLAIGNSNYPISHSVVLAHVLAVYHPDHGAIVPLIKKNLGAPFSPGDNLPVVPSVIRAFFPLGLEPRKAAISVGPSPLQPPPWLNSCGQQLSDLALRFLLEERSITD